MDTIQTYIQQLPEDRSVAIEKLMAIINQHLPKGFECQWSYGMIGWVIPHSIFPAGYHCDPKLPLPFINLASQKNFIALYHMGLYADESLYDWFIENYPKHCSSKLDMGKSCIRFKKIDQIPYELIAELVSKMTVEQWINLYQSKFKK